MSKKLTKEVAKPAGKGASKALPELVEYTNSNAIPAFKKALGADGMKLLGTLMSHHAPKCGHKNLINALKKFA